MTNPACYLATHGVYERGEMPPCDGQLIRAHLVPRQLVKREFRGVQVVMGQTVTPDDIISSPASYVMACGGPMGNGGHHGMFDQARTLRLPRAAVPAWTEGLVLELDKAVGQNRRPFGMWLDREFGWACHEDVGDVCGQRAMTWRRDPNEGGLYPVCAEHDRP
jgi:hypothetical protein